jgi:hypothetical protein
MRLFDQSYNLNEKCLIWSWKASTITAIIHNLVYVTKRNIKSYLTYGEVGWLVTSVILVMYTNSKGITKKKKIFSSTKSLHTIGKEKRTTLTPLLFCSPLNSDSLSGDRHFPLQLPNSSLMHHKCSAGMCRIAVLISVVAITLCGDWAL